MRIFKKLIPGRKEEADVQVSFYDLACKTIEGDDFRFDTLRNKKVLIVNVASRCGFTYQYEGLQKLYNDYGGDDFVILGFPSNDFLKQERGSNEEIKSFCQLNFGVSFPMMSKVKVRGRNKHPVYRWLTEKSLNGSMDSRVKWNFQKYFISREGRLEGMADPGEDPGSEKILRFTRS